MRSMYTPSQITQTVLCNAKSVMKQTSGIAACRFMFKGLLALCHSCLYFHSGYFYVYPVSVLQESHTSSYSILSL